MINVIVSHRPLGNNAGMQTTPAPMRPRLARAFEFAYRPIDRLFHRIYGSELNPLNHAGQIALAALLVLVGTGIYLFIFYRVSDPYGSVLGLHEQWWAGRWIRGMHRYSSDVVIVATIVHAFKMFVWGRTWGPRALAWISGIFVTGVVLVCSWTGMVMVWDRQGQMIAMEGARMFDLAPIFSEPLSRSFSTPDALPNSFFFMNLFLHVATPLGILFLLWLHTSRIARPRLLPPKGVIWTIGASLFALGLLWPPPMLPRADLMALPDKMHIDWLLAFWVPVSQSVSPVTHLLLWMGALGFLVSVPWWWRPKDVALEASHVNVELCTGCTQCYEDCPYDAISMIQRPGEVGRKSEEVARVDPSRCTSCGICAASCAPMGIGPAERTARDQLQDIRQFLTAQGTMMPRVVVIGCGYGVSEASSAGTLTGVTVYLTGCAGSVHTSMMEMMLKNGVGGIFIAACQPNDCSFREGPTWLESRIHAGREADLKSRVDRRRVHIGNYGTGRQAELLADVASFSASLDSITDPAEEISK
jgi:ferredoxin/coenzyme F420-reducing hydrogenase delta subunit